MSAKTKMRVQFIGKNVSYTADNIRFDKINNIAEVDINIGKELIKRGKFIELEVDEDVQAKGKI